jgi:peptidoglycan/xylan/chitin deacetylase (PgdA/CDA1 family)
MTSRNSLTIFITLVYLTFIIIFSSIVFSRYIVFENKVDAETVENNSQFTKHMDRRSKIVVRESHHDVSQFFSKSNSLYLYLTFDDGPTVYTKEILAILEKYKIKSTFFMLYGNIMKRPEEVTNALKNGHSIGCHGVTHKVKEFYKSAQSPKEEMNGCSKAIEKYSGSMTKLVRVPYGSYPNLTSIQKRQLESAGYVIWDWNVDSTDWRLHSPEELVSQVLYQVKSLQSKGIVPVILLHDTKITTKGLPNLIESLQELGYEFRKITPDVKPLQFNSAK